MSRPNWRCSLSFPVVAFSVLPLLPKVAVGTKSAGRRRAGREGIARLFAVEAQAREHAVVPGEIPAGLPVDGLVDVVRAGEHCVGVVSTMPL